MQRRSETSDSAYFRYRYLMGAMQQNGLTQTVRLMCTADEVARLPEIVQGWRNASTRMQDLVASEKGMADRIATETPPSEVSARLHEIESDPLFQASFSAMPTSFMVVSIDELVAPQREVNLDYVSELQGRIEGTSLQEIVDLCVGPRLRPPELNALQTAANQMTFTSRSLDLRFLGGYPKVMTAEDIAVAHAGGQPVEVITLLVGFGAAPINVFQVGTRFVLNNGFHRVIALRSIGVTKIPVVVQHVSNAQIEFPDQVLNLTRAYLLEDPRPVLIKDFFDEALTVELRLKRRLKVVRVAWGEEVGVVPE